MRLDAELYSAPASWIGLPRYVDPASLCYIDIVAHVAAICANFCSENLLGATLCC